MYVNITNILTSPFICTSIFDIVNTNVQTRGHKPKISWDWLVDQEVVVLDKMAGTTATIMGQLPPVEVRSLVHSWNG